MICLKKNLTSYNIVNILIKTRNFIKIFKENNYKKTNIKSYQYLIEKLIYLSYSTKLNIIFVIRQLNKQKANFKISHFKIAKQILQYFKKTIYLRITYGISIVKALSFKHIKYVDSNYISKTKGFHIYNEILYL